MRILGINGFSVYLVNCQYVVFNGTKQVGHYDTMEGVLNSVGITK